MTDELPYCCAACRLLQPPAGSCIDCGSVVIGRLDTEQELLRWASLSVRIEDNPGGRTKRVTGIDLPSPVLAPDAVSRAGIARAIGAPLCSLIDDWPVLAEQISSLITRWRHSVFLRRVHAAPFLLEPEAASTAEPLVISGVLRLVPHVHPPRERLAGDDARLARLGIRRTSSTARTSRS